MSIVWSISQLDRKTVDGFVVCAHWNVYAQDGEYISSAYGTCNWEEGELITPYPDLTEEQVLGWVWQQVSKPDTEAMLLEQIELQKHPVIEPGVPW